MALGVGLGIPFGRSLTPALRIARNIISDWLSDGADVVITSGELATYIKGLGNLDCATCKAKYILEDWTADSATSVLRRHEIATEIKNL